MDKELIKTSENIVGYILKDGPVPYDEVKVKCAKLGVTRGMLKAARRELGVKTINTGNTWLWYIPEEK